MRFAGSLTLLPLALALPLALLPSAARAVDVGSAFTYQGSLTDAGVAPNAPYDFRFSLFDAANGGAQVAGPILRDDVPVLGGVFTVELDFGSGGNHFYGDARWLLVEVRLGASTGAYTPMTRQRLNPSPYAIGLSLPRYEQVSNSLPLLALLNTGSGWGASFEAGPGAVLTYGVSGVTASTASQAAGVRGVASASSGQTIGVEGHSSSTNGTGLVGTGGATGAYLAATEDGSVGMYAYGNGSGGRAEGTGPLSTGFYAFGNFRGVYAESRGIGAAIEARRVSGTGHLILAANGAGNQFWVDNGGITHTKVLEIIGGSDLSERFDIVDEERIAPGTVVSIDPEHEGRLVVSRAAYDHRVAGIVSGAGGVRTGMLMGQDGTVADGEHPVALTGRVYCRATAANGPIVPGDLLTTSSVPGHAMRVDDPARAQGAILGKAMGALGKGEGLVLVLVGLQ